MDTKTINNFYFSRFIDSLENDLEKWESRHCGSYGGTWTEYHGPQYQNKEGKSLMFAETMNYLGAYVNGKILWVVPFWMRFNIFSYQTRRFWSAFRKMKRSCRQKDLKNLNEDLLKAL